MKKGLIAGIIGLIALIIAGITIPAVAHGPNSNNNHIALGLDAWESMQNACRSGDWQAMNEAAREFHNDSDNYGYCFGSMRGSITQDAPGVTGDSFTTGKNGWGHMGSFMGSGMMNGGKWHMGGGMTW